jgi:hypothetical protein
MRVIFRERNHTAMADQPPAPEKRPIGLIEYALIIALVAVIAIGIVIVLLPAINTIITTLRNG